MAGMAGFLLAVRKAAVDIEVADSGCLPGMFLLAAHHDPGVRQAAADTMLSKLQPFDNEDALLGVLQLPVLLDDWVRHHGLDALCSALAEAWCCAYLDIASVDR